MVECSFNVNTYSTLHGGGVISLTLRTTGLLILMSKHHFCILQQIDLKSEVYILVNTS